MTSESFANTNRIQIKNIKLQKMNNLPQDLLFMIGIVMDIRSLMKMTQVNREWQKIGNITIWKRYSHETQLYLDAIRIRPTSSRIFHRFMLQRIRSLHAEEKFSTNSVYRNRCYAMTSKGHQCTRIAHGLNNFCWQHVHKQTKQ